MTYEYVCTSCGHAWEAEQSISAAPLTECPNCKNASAKRQISGGAGFILRGGGWYADGYGSAKSAPSKESSADSGSPAKKPSKPDSGSGSSSDGGSKTSTGSSESGGAKSASSESVTI